jgi:hypothetical protein
MKIKFEFEIRREKISYMSSPIQYIHSPLGETQAATKSPPSLLPDEKLFTTC